MKPNLLSIAGYDPTGGAGVLADVKTFEANRCQGFAVQTANTIQSENIFYSPNWIEEGLILDQLNCILDNYTVEGVKIGLIPSEIFLEKLLEIIRPRVKVIVWDPVMATSSNHKFHEFFWQLDTLFRQIDFVTPNWDEATLWANGQDLTVSLEMWSKHTNILLKGGHHPSEKGWDILFNNGKTRRFKPKQQCPCPKHGSGCVFSSALLANICKGYPTLKAILKTKRYIEAFLNSDKGLLGRHKF